ncbi:MAG: insulinase family protein [Fibrobacter sp.]|nr:insulinase family protein [Fibrobacter sp.]
MRFNITFCYVCLTVFLQVLFPHNNLLIADTIPQNKDSTNVLRATLKNGLRVILLKNSLAPVVTTEMNYLAGSDETPQGFPGTAHALEHMMFRGSPGLSAAQLSDIMALMGGEANAQTRQMATQYYFTIPKEDLDVVLQIESIRMKGIICTDSLWDKERGAIKQEVAQDLSNPVYVYLSTLFKKMFSGTPYEYDALGTDSSFDKTTAEMLKNYHSQWYVPNNAVLVIVGDIDLQQTLNKVNLYFENIPSRPTPPRPAFNFSPVQHEKLLIPSDLPVGLAIFAYRFPGSDSISQYASAQILADVLSSQRGRLYQLVTEGKALSIEFEYLPLQKVGIGFLVTEFAADSSPDNLIQEINHILNIELTNGIDSNLVHAAKLLEISQSEFQKNSIAGLASVWSDAVAVRRRDSPDQDLAAIQMVTVEDVNRCARTYIDSAHSIVSILKPEPSGKQITSSSFGGAESFSPEQTKGVELPEWANSVLSKISIPRSTLNPSVTKLPNGITLIVQPESISNTVSMYGKIKNNPDLQQPPNNEGIADIVNQLFEYGSKTKDRVTLLKSLDSIGAGMSVGSTFSLQTLTGYFSKGVSLLADNLLNPSFPPEAFTVIRNRISSQFAGELQSPDYITNRAILSALLPKGDPQLREPVPSKINKLTVKDAESYYTNVFRPDMTTIVVIGKISPDSAKTVIWNNFKEWKATGKKPQTDYPPVTLNKAATVVVPDKSRIQDAVYLSEIIKVKQSTRDYYALQLGNQILGGSNFSSRLYKDLRINNGLVYHVGSTIDISKKRGTFIVTYACNPDNVVKAKSITIQNIKQMRTSPVQNTELHQAKALMVRQIPLSEASIKSIASGLLKRSVEGLPLNEPTLAATEYLRINPIDMKLAFFRWIFPENLVEVIKGPTPP